MKNRFYPTLCALGLAAFSLGSAGAAKAASVTGAAVLPSRSDAIAPLVFTVSARSGPGGSQGNLNVVEGSNNFFASVVDLCVSTEGTTNLAVVEALITRSTSPRLVGEYFYFFVEDNPTGPDLVDYEASATLVPCDRFVEELPTFFARVGGFPVLQGNLNVSP